MSLQIAAQHLASRGRGPDNQLVHMAPQEVAGLHALARAHGGSLTINPDTGLPEAGFLSNILPMVIGAGLSIASGGALTPLMAAGLTGAATGVATGSLSKGLMAGLGAFGGAGLAGGLTAAGAAGASSGLSALDAGMGVMPTGTIGAAEALAPSALDAGMGAMPTGNIGASALDAGMGAYPGANVAAPAVSPIQAQQAVTQAAPQTVTPMADRFAQAGRGFTNLGTEAGREAFMGNAASKGIEATGIGGLGGLAKYGLAGLAPMMVQDPKQLEEKEKLKAYEYSYNPGRVADPQAGYTGAYTGERTYFNPVYTRTAAGGGLMGIGPVEAMSRANQSQMQPAYAQGGVSDMAVNPYTGAETFAEGGETKAVRPVEQDPYYTMSGQSGDAFKYLMGQMPAASQAPMPVAAPAVAAAPAAATPPAQTAAEANTTMRPYTFDPMTGTFTAMPIIQPTVTGYNPSGFSYESFGGMDGGMGVGMGEGSSGGSGGMSNSGEGGGGPGEGGWARGGIASLAQGGQSHLGDYSDGGRMLRGPGDGVSDSIPATIGGKRPARLADGEFVVPARIVSELGNGSTEAGARKLYAMMARVQKARGKTTGKNRVAVNSRAEKLLPA